MTSLVSLLLVLAWRVGLTQLTRYAGTKLRSEKSLLRRRYSEVKNSNGRTE